MTETSLSTDLAKRLNNHAPGGYWLIRNAKLTNRIQDVISTVPAEWSKRYSDKNYALGDPIFFWFMFNTGTLRWSEITIPDTRNILGKAKAFGLNFGAITSLVDNGHHSVLSVAREDREFTDLELANNEDLLKEAAAEVERKSILTPEQEKVLKDLSEGMSLEASSAASGVAISTVKNRLNKARLALGAESSVQAVAEAVKRGII